MNGEGGPYFPSEIPPTEIPQAVELASTGVLMAELARRSETFIVSMRYRPQQDVNEVVERVHVNGDYRTAQGLACLVIDYCNTEIRKATRPNHPGW